MHLNKILTFVFYVHMGQSIGDHCNSFFPARWLWWCQIKTKANARSKSAPMLAASSSRLIKNGTNHLPRKIGQIFPPTLKSFQNEWRKRSRGEKKGRRRRSYVRCRQDTKCTNLKFYPPSHTKPTYARAPSRGWMMGAG